MSTGTLDSGQTRLNDTGQQQSQLTPKYQATNIGYGRGRGRGRGFGNNKNKP